MNINLEIALFGLEKKEGKNPFINSVLDILQEFYNLEHDVRIFTDDVNLKMGKGISFHETELIQEYFNVKTNDISIVIGNTNILSSMSGKLNCFLFPSKENQNFKIQDPMFWNTDLLLKLDALVDPKAKAKQLLSLFQKKIFDFSKNSGHTRALHFMRHSDIVAAKEVIRPENDVAAMNIKKRIVTDWGFGWDKGLFKKQYSDVGKNLTDVFESVKKESRYVNVENWLKEQTGIKRVLDYGCAHSCYGINLCNAIGAEWLGVDIAGECIEWSYKNLVKYGKYPSKMQFKLGDHKIDLSEEEPFDCLLLMEVLEHVVDPLELIDSLEKWIKPDGKIFITVPYGPWEYMSYHRSKDRYHLWEFNHHDLKEMFFQKKKITLDSFYFAICHELNEPVGWNVITYEKSESPTIPIDLERKIKFQNPTQSLSVNIVVKDGNQDLLEGTLKSVLHLADEINIADYNLTPELTFLLKKYKVNLISTENPLEKGMDVVLNELVKKSNMDWVFQLKAGERVQFPSLLRKYLRSSAPNTISMDQVYISGSGESFTETEIKLFRRNVEGKEYKYFGFIYENIGLLANEYLPSHFIIPDVSISSLRYIEDSERVNEISFNLEILNRFNVDQNHRIYKAYCLMRDQSFFNTLEWKQTGKISDHTIQRCKYIIAIFRKLFLSNFENKTNFKNAILFYSEACRILGTGIKVDLKITSNNGRKFDIMMNNLFFQTTNDLQEELLYLIEGTEC